MAYMSWNRLSALLIKEFTQMLRDRMTFALMVVMPIMQLILFGYAINSDPKNLPLSLIDQDQSIFSRSIVKTLESSGYFKVQEQFQDEKKAQYALNTGNTQFVLNIPSDFTARLLKKDKPNLLLEVDATDPVATANALGATLAISQAGLPHDFVGPLSYLIPPKPAFDIIVHRNFNPEAVTQYNIVPGLIGTILTLTMVIITSMAVTRERERGTLEQLLSMPVSPIEVMIGKIIPYVIVGILQVAVILGVAKLLFNVPIEGSLLILSVGILFFIAANLMVGYTFSTLAKSQLQASQMTIFFFLPSMLLSGFMFPFRGMPDWAQMIGNLLPLTHFLKIVRGVLLKGNGWAETLPNLWPIILFLIVAMAIALARYRDTLD